MRKEYEPAITEVVVDVVERGRNRSHVAGLAPRKLQQFASGHDRTPAKFVGYEHGRRIALLLLQSAHEPQRG